MITTLEEMRKVRRMVERCQAELDAAGKEQGHVTIGLMLEVPAAAVAIDDLLEVVDFVSIGSNDLVQYLMAADRDNPKVSHLCQPLSPPVLKILASVIGSCLRARKSVTLCGEMAGLPRAYVLLFGMGLRKFSMSPAFIPSIKELTHRLTKRRAEVILQRASRFKTSRQIIEFMGKQVHEICPSLDLMDSA
jgi:phosphotransferase system enzyme I (PtsI)